MFPKVCDKILIPRKNFNIFVPTAKFYAEYFPDARKSCAAVKRSTIFNVNRFAIHRTTVCVRMEAETFLRKKRSQNGRWEEDKEIVNHRNTRRKRRFKRRVEAKKEIPKDVPSPIYLYSHVLVLISRLLIAKTLLTCAWTARREERRHDDNDVAGVALKCARNARARGREGGRAAGGKDYVGYDEGHGSGDNERGVNHSGQTVPPLTMRRARAREKRTLCLGI